MTENENLYFRTNVQLKSIIGKDLINDDNIAILELVKNAFDADAKRVDIVFLNIKENIEEINDSGIQASKATSKILIKDDGIGMDIKDIKDKWLNIAYSEKKHNNRQHNRLMAGAKGVGRFSCDRLGKYLNLYTKKADSISYILLTINWESFEIENDINKEIQSIPIQYTTLNQEEIISLGIEPFKQGVLLEIMELRRKWATPEHNLLGQIWDVEKLISLKKYLEKLINPNQAFVENDFGIFLSAPEFNTENSMLPENEKFIGKVENRIFEKLDFKSTSIEAETIENGAFIVTELKDRGETIFRIKEKNTFSPDIINAKVVLYYLNPYAKAFFTKQTGIRSFEYGSIFLFINGFRVPPYGEPGNDWLLIEQRKGQGYARFFGSREVVGRIEILDRSDNFKIVSSREGVVRNNSYRKLTDIKDGFFFKAFRRLEKYVVEGLDWDSIPKEKNYQEIEKKIISGETNENELVYREDDSIKRRRIYGSIHSIISATHDDVEELYINESLITDKIAEERENSEREFDQLITDFEKKKIDSSTLEKILLRKAAQNKELEKQIKEFAKYSVTESTTIAIAEIQNYKKTIDSQQKLIAQLKTQIEAVEKEVAAAEAIVSEAQSEIEKVREELIETRSQNLFLKSIKSQDLNEVLNLMHHIGISASTVQNYSKGVIFKIENDMQVSGSELKNVFSKINYEINKINSISKFATKANFKINTKDTQLNIIEFIEQYLINVVKPFLPSSLKLIVYKSPVSVFELSFKPIEMIIVIDNLINNSKKAKASLIEVSFESLGPNRLDIHFADNGKGIDKKIADKIFDYGFTTTDGSGLGLAHVVEIIEKMGGRILLNEAISSGAEFVIKLSKF